MNKVCLKKRHPLLNLRLPAGEEPRAHERVVGGEELEVAHRPPRADRGGVHHDDHRHEQVHEAEQRGASKEELLQILGRARAKKGMFEGNLQDGELEIGQVSALLDDILPAAVITENIWKEFNEALTNPLGSS